MTVINAQRATFEEREETVGTEAPTRLHKFDSVGSLGREANKVA